MLLQVLQLQMGLSRGTTNRITFLGVMGVPNTPIVGPGHSPSQTGNEDWGGGSWRGDDKRTFCLWALLSSAETPGSLARLEDCSGIYGI